jgi:sialic acid synthase SpsE
LVDFAAVAQVLHASSGTKSEHFERVEQLRSIFRKGVYWNESLPKGTVIDKNHLKFLKPVRSIDVIDYEVLIGKTLEVEVSSGEPVKFDQLSG